MSVNERVLPPGVNSTVVMLDDDITLTDVYVHNFTLYYIIRNDVTSLPGPKTTAVFTFGTYPHITLLLLMIVLFTDKSNLQILFGPFHFCLDWDVSYTNTHTHTYTHLSMVPISPSHTHTHTHTHTYIHTSSSHYDARLSLPQFVQISAGKENCWCEESTAVILDPGHSQTVLRLLRLNPFLPETRNISLPWQPHQNNLPLHPR